MVWNYNFLNIFAIVQLFIGRKWIWNHLFIVLMIVFDFLKSLLIMIFNNSINDSRNKGEMEEILNHYFRSFI